MKNLKFVSVGMLLALFFVHSVYAGVDVQPSKRKIHTVSASSSGMNEFISPELELLPEGNVSPGMSVNSTQQVNTENIDRNVSGKVHSHTVEANKVSPKYLANKSDKSRKFPRLFRPIGGGPTESAKVDGFALSGMIVGILGCFLLGVLLGPIAIVLSIIGLIRILSNREKHKGLGYAIAGLATGFVGFVASVIILLLIL